jgi:hypothetical protein
LFFLRWKKTSYRLPKVYRCKVKVDESRHLLFASDEQLALLEKAKRCYPDWTRIEKRIAYGNKKSITVTKTNTCVHQNPVPGHITESNKHGCMISDTFKKEKIKYQMALRYTLNIVWLYNIFIRYIGMLYILLINGNLFFISYFRNLVVCFSTKWMWLTLFLISRHPLERTTPRFRGRRNPRMQFPLGASSMEENKFNDNIHSYTKQNLKKIYYRITCI